MFHPSPLYMFFIVYFAFISALFHHKVKTQEQSFSQTYAFNLVMTHFYSQLVIARHFPSLDDRCNLVLPDDSTHPFIRLVLGTSRGWWAFGDGGKRPLVIVMCHLASPHITASKYVRRGCSWLSPFRSTSRGQTRRLRLWITDNTFSLESTSKERRLARWYVSDSREDLNDEQPSTSSRGRGSLQTGNVGTHTRGDGGPLPPRKLREGNASERVRYIGERSASFALLSR